MIALIGVSVARRACDTRMFGTVREEVEKAQAARAREQPVSTPNARLGLGRALVDFLEDDLPLVMAALVQLAISAIVLFAFDPILACAGMVAVAAMLLIYGPFHRRFYGLNGHLNRQTERQIDVLAVHEPDLLLSHLTRLRRVEVRLFDTESVLYGAIFVVLSGLVVFNLRHATATLQIATGTIFSILTYSWEFADSALPLPVTLQGWSRLSEIARRINTAVLSTTNGRYR